MILQTETSPFCKLAESDHLTWVCGRDDGTKEKAVSVVELVGQLSDHLHQFDHAVHQVPAEQSRPEGSDD